MEMQSSNQTLNLDKIQPLVPANTAIAQLEEEIWVAIENHAQKGGIITSGTWGIDVRSNGTILSLPSYVPVFLPKNADCRCALGCLITPENLNSGFEDKWSAQTYGLCAASVASKLLSLTTQKISQIIAGFDTGIELDSDAYRSLGVRLRKRAQQLPEWRGVKVNG